MNQKIVVSGMGLYTALGKGLQTNFDSLSSQAHALTPLHFLDTAHALEFPFGEIKISTSALLDTLKLPRNKGYTRTSLLGITAMQEALANAGIDRHAGLKVGIINATTVRGMCEVEKYYFKMLEEEGDFSEFSDTIDCADCTHRLADHFKIKDYVTTISTACSSSANAIILGTRLVNQGHLDIAICGGTDALTRFTINGFNALKNIDKQPCKPFDEARNGLNLGEGAAYLVIEKETSCLQRNHKPIAEMKGYCNFNESFHATAPNPKGEGAYQVMKRALLKAQLEPNDIHYINAHGTATLTNDESEANAMKRLFGSVPSFSSTKCYTGHTLAAAGAVEAIFSILALEQQCVYANLNFANPIPDSALIPQLFHEKKQLQNVMSNSFAFGGNNASLIFSKMESKR
ncbi:MAG: beta-ketoacyl-[acyl-carrier-protein] synthase family protein [Bacteroidetes bacterium]|nr:beta-ketoacyl-[acyl-carrier-protein] synthase family protein [Bacteroidota bacterium]